MRILHVFKTYYPDSFGGIEQVIRQICLSTMSGGVSSRVFTVSRSAKEKPLLEDAGIPVVRAQTDFELASTPFSRAAIQTYKEELAQADLVHFHYPWPFGDLMHLLAGGRKPSVLTYHSDVVKQSLLMPVYRPVMRRFFQQIDAIVPTSPNYLESSEALQEFRNKATIIPIGLDQASYPKVDEDRVRYWEAKVGRDFFLFVGVLRYYKGLHILLDASKGSRTKTVIVGSGPMESDLKEQAKRLALDNVHMLGALDDVDKVALLHLCRAVVFSSHLRSEAFGVTLLEGAMYAKPIISAEISTGSSYVNINGETGLIVPPSDPSALRAAMESLLDKPEWAQQLGARARARFLALFTAEEMGRAYADLYRKVLDQRTQHRGNQ